MFKHFGAVESLSSEQLKMIALGEKIIRDLNTIKSTRAFTSAEQAIYDTLKQVQDEQDKDIESTGLAGFGYDCSQSLFSQHKAFSDFGRNIFTPLTTTLKRAVKVVSAPITVVRKLTQGNVKGAVNTALDMVNPIVAVTKVVTDDPRKLNYARLTMPTSVVNITDRDLRKKAAIGYAAAAVIAGAAFALTAGTAVATGAGAGATAAGGAGTLATVTGAVGTAAKVGGLISTATGLIKGGDEEPQERAGVGIGEPVYEKEIQHMSTQGKIALGIGGVSVLVFTVWYFQNRR